MSERFAACHRWLECTADMIPDLFESARASDEPTEYLLGERMIDG